MKTLFKKTLFLLLLFTGLLPESSLHAQEKDPSSQWMIGVNTGINIYNACAANCPKDVAVTAMQHQSIYTQVRPFRRWAFGLNIAQYQMNVHASKRLWRESLTEVPLAQSYYKSNTFVASLGTEFLIRLGQGDLGLEGRLGYGGRFAKIAAQSLEGESFQIQFHPEGGLFQSLKLGYTYWPKPQFGIHIGVEMMSISYLAQRQVLSTPAAVELEYPEVDPKVFVALNPDIGNVTSANIILGFTYRFP